MSCSVGDLQTLWCLPANSLAMKAKPGQRTLMVPYVHRSYAGKRWQRSDRLMYSCKHPFLSIQSLSASTLQIEMSVYVLQGTTIHADYQ